MFKPGERVIVILPELPVLKIGSIVTIRTVDAEGFVTLNEFEPWEYFYARRFIPLTLLTEQLV